MSTATHFWDELAINAYKSIVKKTPDCVLAHHNLGLAYTRIGKTNKAIRAFQRAVKLDKSSTESYYHMGRLYQDKGMEKEALRCFKNYNKHKQAGDKFNQVVPALIELLKEDKE